MKRRRKRVIVQAGCKKYGQTASERRELAGVVLASRSQFV